MCYAAILRYNCSWKWNKYVLLEISSAVDWFLAPSWNVYYVNEAGGRQGELCSVQIIHADDFENFNQGRWGSLNTNHAPISLMPNFDTVASRVVTVAFVSWSAKFNRFDSRWWKLETYFNWHEYETVENHSNLVCSLICFKWIIWFGYHGSCREQNSCCFLHPIGWDVTKEYWLR